MRKRKKQLGNEHEQNDELNEQKDEPRGFPGIGVRVPVRLSQ